MMKKSGYKYLLLVFIIAGCAQATRLKSTYRFPEEQWKRFENPVLDFNIESPGIYYDMFLELEFDARKTFHNLPVTVIMNTPSGEMRARDIVLKAQPRGGDGEISSTIRTIIRKAYAFSEKGGCKFEIENRSSKVYTGGVKNISIVLEKSQ